jgi:hypothetical protein
MKDNKPTYHPFSFLAKLGLMLMLFQISTTGLRAQELKPEVSLDTAKIRIGEQITYTISIPKTAREIIFPERLDLMGLEELYQSPYDTIRGRVFKQYRITGFDSGAFYIPSQQLLINNRRMMTDSLLVEVATVTVDTIKNPLNPIKPLEAEPYVFDDFEPYIKWGLIILLSILALFFGIQYWRNRDKDSEPEPQIPPYEEAKNRLEALDLSVYVAEGRFKDYYSELTDILRTYVEDEYHLPAKESTTDELLDFLKDFNELKRASLSPELLAKLKALLQDADLVKFAKMTPDQNALSSDKALTEYLIDEFEQALIRKEEEDVES